MNIYCKTHNKELEIESDLGSEIHVHCGCSETLAARLAEAEAELKFFRNAFPSAARNWQIVAAPVKDAPCICAEIFTAGVVNPDCPQHGSMTD